MSALTRPQKITFAEMREVGVRGILVHCADYRCSHSSPAQRRPIAGRVSGCRVSNPRFVCQARGKRGADVWPDFNWNKVSVGAMGYR
jgi:hypothetical protein